MDPKHIPNIYNIRDLEKICIKTKDGYTFIRIALINYCEVDNNYTFIHNIDKSRILTICSLTNVMKKLPEETFFQCHGSFLVNLNQIADFDKTSSMLILENKVNIPLSVKKMKDFFTFYNN